MEVNFHMLGLISLILKEEHFVDSNVNQLIVKKMRNKIVHLIHSLVIRVPGNYNE